MKTLLLTIVLNMLNAPSDADRIEYDRYIETNWEEAEEMCEYVLYDESEPYLNPLIFEEYLKSCE